MALLYLFGTIESVVLWILLLASLALTFWECRERQYPTKITLWWMLFIFTIAHIVGYLILRFLVRPQSKKAK